MKKMILSRVTLLQLQKCCIPFLIGATIGLTLYTFAGWWGFLLIFPWIGFSITLGCLIAIKRKGIKKDLGRRICLLMISPLFLLFLGICQRENLQLEEFVFYLLLFLQTGKIVRVFIHFCIAKIFGPFIWGRGFCGQPLSWNGFPSRKTERLRHILPDTAILPSSSTLAFPCLLYGWDTTG